MCPGLHVLTCKHLLRGTASCNAAMGDTGARGRGIAAAGKPCLLRNCQAHDDPYRLCHAAARDNRHASVRMPGRAPAVRALCLAVPWRPQISSRTAVCACNVVAPARHAAVAAGCRRARAWRR
jgi:hypothetical protein